MNDFESLCWHLYFAWLQFVTELQDLGRYYMHGEIPESARWMR